MDDDELEGYRKAGDIAKKVRQWSKKIVKPGALLLELAEGVESKIVEEGGMLAFPVNLCVNDVTAHYTPKADDDSALGEGDVVSVDLGVHVDGYIADTAYTLDFSGEYGPMLEANEAALDAVLSEMKPGVSVSALGGLVQSTLNGAGYKPIENLTGHEVKPYDLHAGFSIPNIPVPYDWRIEEGMALAIEPFATDGYGRVVESKNAYIYSLLLPKPTRNREARAIIAEVAERRKLPFAQRWLAKNISPLRLAPALRELTSRDILKAYHELHEREHGVVSQFEHTLVVTADGCEVTTR